MNYAQVRRSSPLLDKAKTTSNSESLSQGKERKISSFLEKCLDRDVDVGYVLHLPVCFVLPAAFLFVATMECL